MFTLPRDPQGVRGCCFFLDKWGGTEFYTKHTVTVNVNRRLNEYGFWVEGGEEVLSFDTHGVHVTSDEASMMCNSRLDSSFVTYDTVVGLNTLYLPMRSFIVLSRRAKLAERLREEMKDGEAEW